ncbi:MAG: hypothetical protein AAFV98_10655 [Chloroflexota bacterium]
MSQYDEFDDIRGLTSDGDDDEFSFDDIVDDDAAFGYGQEILTEEEIAAANAPGPVEEFVSSMSAQERMFLSLMLFANIAVLGLALLLATNRISF